MLTKAVHKRFWRTMGERFGKRWLEEYGEIPTKAWTDMLDRYTPEDIAQALLNLKDRPEKNRSYPPTHDEFDALLVRAARSNHSDGVDYVRGYWRSAVITNVLHEGVMLERWSNDPEEFEQIVVNHRLTLGGSMVSLLDELCDGERRANQRTPGLQKLCADRARLIALAFRAQPQPKTAQLL